MIGPLLEAIQSCTDVLDGRTRRALRASTSMTENGRLCDLRSEQGERLLERAHAAAYIFIDVSRL